MKYLVFICLIYFGLVSTAKADTIDYWHVYYNNVKLKEYNAYSDNQIIILSAAKIRQTDSIKVYFFRDTRCTDCDTYLTVDAEKDVQLASIKGKGIGNALSFSLQDLLAYMKKTGKRNFEVSYADRVNVFQARKPIIFTIQLE